MNTNIAILFLNTDSLQLYNVQDMEETECRPVKRSKSSSLEPQLTLDSEGFNFGG